MKKASSKCLNLTRPTLSRFPVIRQVPRFEGLMVLEGRFINHHFSPHFHEEYAVGVIQAGAQQARIGKHQHVLMPAGSVVVINPGEVHTGQPADECGWIYSMLYIPVRLMRDICLQHIDGMQHDPEFSNPTFFDSFLAKRIIALQRALESNNSIA